MTAFNEWLDTFIEEKAIDPENTVAVNGPSGVNIIPIGTVIEAIKRTTPNEKAQIKKTLVVIDFKNGDPVHFLKHIAQAIAR